MPPPISVEIVPYSADWPERARREIEQLTDALGPVLYGVHHIGSPAVPGSIRGAAPLDCGQPCCRFLQPALLASNSHSPLQTHSPTRAPAFQSGRNSRDVHGPAPAGLPHQSGSRLQVSKFHSLRRSRLPVSKSPLLQVSQSNIRSRAFRLAGQKRTRRSAMKRTGGFRWISRLFLRDGHAAVSTAQRFAGDAARPWYRLRGPACCGARSKY